MSDHVHQYTFTVVFMAVRQTDHSREQSVFIECFYVLLQGTAAALCTLSPSLSSSVIEFLTLF